MTPLAWCLCAGLGLAVYARLVRSVIGLHAEVVRSLHFGVCAGLILMAIGMAGLGYAAQRVIVATAAKKARDALLSKASPEPYPADAKEEASVQGKGSETGLIAEQLPADNHRALEVWSGKWGLVVY